jgi:hypothetical protein
LCAGYIVSLLEDSYSHSHGYIRLILRLSIKKLRAITTGAFKYAFLNLTGLALGFGQWSRGLDSPSTIA